MTKPEGATKLYVVPCSKKSAADFIYHVHRHHLPLDFATYFLAVCTPDGVVHGVAAIGRTVTQHLKMEGIPNEWIQEVRRVATDGTPNACSALYGAAWRFVREMGYRALCSYTLPVEGGASLRALGWREVPDVGGNSWAHRGTRGVDVHPTSSKTRWEVSVHPNKLPPFNNMEWPNFDNRVQQRMFESNHIVAGADGVGGLLQNTLFDTIFDKE